MEALKKAEAAKRRSQTDTPAPDEGMTLELTPLGDLPKETSPPAVASLPELPTDLEILDAEFLHSAPAAHRAEPAPSPEAKKPAASAVEPPKIPVPEIPYEPREMRGDAPTFQARSMPTSKSEGRSGEQESIQNLFDAKQPPPSRRNFAIAAGLLGLTGAVAIGIYFWMQLQPKSSLSLAARGLPPQPPVVAPVQPVPAAPSPAQPPVQEAEAAQEPEVASAKPATAPPPPAAEPVQTPASPIRVTLSKVKLDPSLDKGYGALQQGDLGAALSAYEAALKNDPVNLDALHGMAIANQRLGKSAEAEQYFQRALETDPKDGLAIAGLVSLRGQPGGVQAESRLKGVLAEQPGNPAVNFALGNLYAQQGRWGEAQQAYFKAMESDPDNADYLFNLAVALDQLHQIKPAAQYYARAIAAAQKRTGGFDVAQAAERLKKLQP